MYSIETGSVIPSIQPTPRPASKSARVATAVTSTIGFIPPISSADARMPARRNPSTTSLLRCSRVRWSLMATTTPYSSQSTPPLVVLSADMAAVSAGSVRCSPTRSRSLYSSVGINRGELAASASARIASSIAVVSAVVRHSHQVTPLRSFPRVSPRRARISSSRIGAPSGSSASRHASTWMATESCGSRVAWSTNKDSAARRFSSNSPGCSFSPGMWCLRAWSSPRMMRSATGTEICPVSTAIATSV